MDRLLATEKRNDEKVDAIRIIMKDINRNQKNNIRRLYKWCVVKRINITYDKHSTKCNMCYNDMYTILNKGVIHLDKHCHREFIKQWTRLTQDHNNANYTRYILIREILGTDVSLALIKYISFQPTIH